MIGNTYWILTLCKLLIHSLFNLILTVLRSCGSHFRPRDHESQRGPRSQWLVHSRVKIWTHVFTWNQKLLAFTVIFLLGENHDRLSQKVAAFWKWGDKTTSSYTESPLGPPFARESKQNLKGVELPRLPWQLYQAESQQEGDILSLAQHREGAWTKYLWQPWKCAAPLSCVWA